MRKYGLGILLVSVMVVLLVACGGNAAPETTGPPAADAPPVVPPSGPQPEATISWSDWPGKPTARGQDVTIPEGETVLLDESPPPLGSLQIDGALIFARQDLELSAASIMVHGGLFIGSEAEPFSQQAIITLTGQRTPDTAEKHAGDRFLSTMQHGLIEIHGLVGPSWTVLKGDAPAGSTSITVADASGWQAGDQIVVATTDFPRWPSATATEVQTEERTVAGISGNVLQLDQPLDYLHIGEIMHVAGAAVDQRAEVARLSRNIVIQGPESTLDPGSADYGFGGHVMIMPGGTARITGVEFRRMGQRGILARYPMHFHILRDGGAGSYVRSSAVHESFNRCLTIHGTNHVLVHDVVGFGSPGHCFFLEDGAEMGNTLQGNLALAPRVPDEGYAILPSDTHLLGPAGFWITHPDNTLIGNHAVASRGTGIWYALPPEPVGEFFAWHGDQGIRPRSSPLGVFRNNTAHSNSFTGLHVDHGFGPDLNISGATRYTPRHDPLDRESEPVLAVFEDLHAWRNRDAGAWFRGDSTVLRGGVLSDNPIGVTFASNDSWAEQVTFIGRTPNPGTPTHWETTGANGETLGRDWDPDFVIRGFEFYDGDVGVKDSFFAGYESDSVRGAAALSYKDYTAFDTSSLNWAENLRFAPGTERVLLAYPVPEGYSADGYRSAIFIDSDGSVTGTARTTVAFNNPFLAADGCRQEGTFRALLCPPAAKFASLMLQAVNAGNGALQEVTITRSDDEAHTMLGTPNTSRYRTNLLLDESYSYDYQDPDPLHLRVQLYDAPAGTLLPVSLPYTGSEPFIYRDWWIDSRNLLTRHDSLTALTNSADSGYFHDGTRLHLNLVVQADRDWAQVEICRRAGC